MYLKLSFEISNQTDTFKNQSLFHSVGDITTKTPSLMINPTSVAVYMIYDTLS